MNEYRDPSKYPRENPVTIQCREIFNTASIVRETIQGENNGVWCLTPLSKIIQLYCGFGKFQNRKNKQKLHIQPCDFLCIT
jgi:hypothetical protein